MHDSSLHRRGPASSGWIVANPTLRLHGPVHERPIVSAPGMDRAVESLLLLHFVEVLEAAGRDDHDGEEEEVVGGVDNDAGGQGAGLEADSTQHQTD